MIMSSFSVSNLHGKRFLVFKWQRAKKTYYCRNCENIITEGSKYYRMIGKSVFLNQFFDMVLCEKCGREKLQDLDI